MLQYLWYNLIKQMNYLKSVKKDLLAKNRRRITLNLNKVRITCGILYLLGVFLNLNSYTNAVHFYIAFAVGFIYLIYFITATILSVFMKKLESDSQYFSFFIDYLIFFAVIVVRAVFESESYQDISLYIFKNPIFSVLYVLLILPLLYLKKSLIIYSTAIYSFIFIASITFLVIFSPDNITSIWKEHTLGDKVSVKFAIFHGFLGIALSVISYYSLQFFNSLMNKISSTEIEKNRLKQYFSPNLYKQLLSDETSQNLDKGIRAQLTTLFIDIKKFTNLSEQLPPEELVKFLSQFRKIAVESIFKYSGVVDKFIGDAILANFGIPISNVKTDLKTSSWQASQSAIEIYNKIQKMNLETDELIGCEIRMGIAAGETFIGNIKSYSQLEYTVIGRHVNLASRLQSLCKEYDASCIISNTVYENIIDKIPTKQELPNISIRGFKEPMNVHILL